MAPPSTPASQYFCTPRLTTGWVLSLIALTGAVAFALNLCGCQSANGPATRQAAIQTYVEAMMLYQDGDRDKALVVLQQAVQQHGELVMPHSMLGDLYQSKKDYSDALEQYRQVVRLDPYAYENRFKLGLMYQLLDRLEEAVAGYLGALQLNPQDFRSNLNLATVYLALGKPEEALKYAQQATVLNAKSAAAWSNLGVTYDSLKMYKSAEEAYRKTMELDSDLTQTAFYLAENLMHQGKYADAKSVMGLIVLRQDSPLARKRFGDAMFMSKQYDDAIIQYENALKLDPRYCPALNEEGKAMIQQYVQGLSLDEPKRATAVELWKRSLGINPNQPAILSLVQQYDRKFAQ